MGKAPRGRGRKVNNGKFDAQKFVDALMHFVELGATDYVLVLHQSERNDVAIVRSSLRRDAISILQTAINRMKKDEAEGAPEIGISSAGKDRKP
jgi:hypothetical protein